MKVGVATCMICGCKVVISSSKFFSWCRHHGTDGEDHGIIDDLLRLLKIRKYKEYWYE